MQMSLSVKYDIAKSHLKVRFTGKIYLFTIGHALNLHILVDHRNPLSLIYIPSLGTSNSRQVPFSVLPLRSFPHMDFHTQIDQEAAALCS